MRSIICAVRPGRPCARAVPRSHRSGGRPWGRPPDDPSRGPHPWLEDEDCPAAGHGRVRPLHRDPSWSLFGLCTAGRRRVRPRAWHTVQRGLHRPPFQGPPCPGCARAGPVPSVMAASADAHVPRERPLRGSHGCPGEGGSLVWHPGTLGATSQRVVTDANPIRHMGLGHPGTLATSERNPCQYREHR